MGSRLPARGSLQALVHPPARRLSCNRARPRQSASVAAAGLAAHHRRSCLPEAQRDAGAGSCRVQLAALSAALCSVAALAMPEAASAALHVEPANALSLPTWAIHTASVAEWLVAMDLVWRYGEHTGRGAWKGLAWGMLPLHTSSLCACTYHLFYNAESLAALVTLQAGLTFVGNCTLFAAAARIAGSDASDAQLRSGSAEGGDASFLVGSLVFSLASGAAVKWGSLLLDPLFEPSLPLALAIIFGVTALTGAALAQRSTTGEASAR